MHRSYSGVWFGSKIVSKEMLLTGPKFHLNTNSGSGVTLKEKTFAKEIFANFIFAIYDHEKIISAKISFANQPLPLSLPSSSRLYTGRAKIAEGCLRKGEVTSPIKSEKKSSVYY